MKKLKNLSLFNDLLIITLALLLFLYIKNILVLIMIITYLIYHLDYKAIIIFITLLLLIYLRQNLFIDTKYYIVINPSNNGYVISNFISDINIKTDKELNIGDIVKINGKLLKEDKLANKAKGINYYYSDYQVYKVLHLFSFRNLLYQKYLLLKPSILKDFIAKTLFKVTNYDDELITSINLSCYFIYRFVNELINKTRFKRFSIIFALLFISLLFGLRYTILRIIVYEILLKLTNNKTVSISISMILLILYQPFSIYSYSFIIPFLLRIIFIFKNKYNFKVIIILINSYLFNSFNLLQVYYYRYFLIIIAFLTLLSISYLFINLSFIEIFIINVLKIISILKIEIKGQLSLISLIMFIYAIKIFKISKNNQVYILLLLLISNISNIYSSITFIDVGQGSAILIRDHLNKGNILIDTGREYEYYKLARTLNKFGIYEIDKLIITHNDKDHSDNIKNLYRDYKIKDTIITHEDVYLNKLFLKSLNNDNHNNKNDNSLVYYLTINNLKFLFTGDISKDVEEEIIRQYPDLKVDILSLSHHGSKSGTSNKILNNYQVKLAIASTSGMYNHPHQEIIDKLSLYQIPLLQTNIEGNIIFVFNPIYSYIYTNNTSRLRILS